MKNTLAENMLRFGVKNLSEADIKKIFEQTTAPTGSAQQQAGTVKLSGNSAAALQSIPGIIIQPTKNVTPPGAYIANENFAEFLVNYLGGPGSNLANIIGKTILVFRESLYTKGGTNTTSFTNFNTDASIPLTFIPKAYYVGKRNFESTGEDYTYFFDREITTNYSGDKTKPFIIKPEGQEAFGKISDRGDDAYIADLNVRYGQSDNAKLAADPEKPEQTLEPRWTQFGKRFNMLKVRHYDGAVFYNAIGGKPIGNASYLTQIGFPAFGTMAGITKIA